MISFGSTDKDFYCFAEDAVENGFPILHIQMVKARDKHNREIWVPNVKEILRHNVHHIGLMKVALKKPQKLVDLSSFHESAQKPLRTMEIEAGQREFEVLSIELPKRIGRRVIEIAILPGTVYGLAFSGLCTILADHERYWKQRETLHLLELLRRELMRRLVLQTLEEVRSLPSQPIDPAVERFLKVFEGQIF